MVLKTEYVLTGGTSTPPTTPTHDLLTLNSWNNDNTNITRDTDIGAIYDTTDGKTHCFVTMTLASGYQPTIYLNKNKFKFSDFNFYTFISEEEFIIKNTKTENTVRIKLPIDNLKKISNLEDPIFLHLLNLGFIVLKDGNEK